MRDLTARRRDRDKKKKTIVTTVEGAERDRMKGDMADLTWAVLVSFVLIRLTGRSKRKREWRRSKFGRKTQKEEKRSSAVVPWAGRKEKKKRRKGANGRWKWDMGSTDG